MISPLRMIDDIRARPVLGHSKFHILFTFYGTLKVFLRWVERPHIHYFKFFSNYLFQQFHYSMIKEFFYKTCSNRFTSLRLKKKLFAYLLLFCMFFHVFCNKS